MAVVVGDVATQSLILGRADKSEWTTVLAGGVESDLGIAFAIVLVGRWGVLGLGLAYAQQGDKPKALNALRTYISHAPGAKDAPLIRKRISSLQGR